MVERIAIVGSRDYPGLGEVEAYVNTLPHNAVVVSGGARGVDSVAVARARARGLAVKEHLPDYRKYGRYLAPKIRNQAVVDDCTRLVAFWNLSSTGTTDAIERARLASKPFEVFSPRVRWLRVESAPGAKPGAFGLVFWGDRLNVAESAAYGVEVLRKLGLLSSDRMRIVRVLRARRFGLTWLRECA